MMKDSEIRSILIFVFLWPIMVHGQNDVPVYDVSFQTLFLNRSSETFTYLNQGRVETLPVNYDIVSQTVRYQGTSPMLIFRGEPNLEAGDLERQAVARIPLISLESEFTLICASENGNLACMPINSSNETMPRGTFCFINATSNQVIGVLEAERISIPPRSFEMVPGDNLESRRIPIRLAFMAEEEWEVFYSTEWTALGQKRAFVIVYNSPRNGRLTVRGVEFR
ncbi:hypothetical protein QEH59_05470 [Coraliomargarita sp. SDUM461004]|uniref:DUF3108 domain-containing protein n=1 Tax=Thalassobacterium sedimentorum TaxID=3041258 RepID=A0ABU1AGA6_9BACT|nr:hypothetical protein [Coraliomargarita sp. SDUM461004]MDQ8193862.1 hypothetical protein [Coraliomargarita sp. SDUM461004]